jgi:hypothetical protein
MNFLNDNKVYIGLSVLVFCALLYFYINYQVSVTLKHELSKMKKQKQLKLNQQSQQSQLAKRHQYMQSRTKQIRQDADSYFDPAGEEAGNYQEEGDFDENDQQDQRVPGGRDQGQGQRLTKDNILMRDMMGL